MKNKVIFSSFVLFALSGCTSSNFTEATLTENLIEHSVEGSEATIASQRWLGNSDAMALTFLAVSPSEFEVKDNIDYVDLDEFDEAAGVVDRNLFSLIGTVSLLALNANNLDALAFGFASSKPQGVNPWYGENILFEIIPLTKKDNLESQLRSVRERQLTITRNMFKSSNVPYIEHTLPVGVEAFLGGNSYKYGIPEVMFVRTDLKKCSKMSKSDAFQANHEIADGLMHCVVKVNTVQNTTLIKGEIPEDDMPTREKPKVSFPKAERYLVSKVGIPTTMPLHHIAAVKQDNSYLYMAPMGWSSISSAFEDDNVRNSYLAAGDASVYPKVIYLSTGQETYFSAQLGYIYVQERDKRKTLK